MKFLIRVEESGNFQSPEIKFSLHHSQLENSRACRLNKIIKFNSNKRIFDKGRELIIFGNKIFPWFSSHYSGLVNFQKLYLKFIHVNQEPFYLRFHPTLSTSWVIYREGKLLIKRFDSFWDDSQTIAKFLEHFSNRIDCLLKKLHAFSWNQFFSSFFVSFRNPRETNEKNFTKVCETRIFWGNSRIYLKLLSY